MVVLAATDSAYFKMITADWLGGDKYNGESDGKNNFSNNCKYIDELLVNMMVNIGQVWWLMC